MLIKVPVYFELEGSYKPEFIELIQKAAQADFTIRVLGRDSSTRNIQVEETQVEISVLSPRQAMNRIKKAMRS